MEVCEEFYWKNKEEIEDAGNLTGDQSDSKYFLLHRDERFYWLNYHIAKSVREYLESMCRKKDDCRSFDYNIFIQKAWVTVCNSEQGRTPDHTHKGSHFSAIYYLRTAGEGGSLVLSNCSMFDSLPINLHDELSHHEILPEDGDLVIIPSSLLHRVDEFYGVDFRASFVYDIFVTSTTDVDHEYENVITSPHHWVQV